MCAHSEQIMTNAFLLNAVALQDLAKFLFYIVHVHTEKANIGQKNVPQKYSTYNPETRSWTCVSKRFHEIDSVFSKVIRF